MPTPWPWLGDATRTAARRARLWQLLGPRPRRSEGVSGQRLSVEEVPTARMERWSLRLNEEEPVPALLLLPRDRAPHTLVLYCHAHGNRFDCGKDEVLVGRPALATPPYGEVLPPRGYAVLAIDHFCFGERAGVGMASEEGRVKRLLWAGRTLWGYRVHDSLAALDWADTHDALVRLPIIALGLSMGSTMALWCAALDERVDACVDLCCLAEYESLLATGSAHLHGAYFFVPGLLGEFTAAEINALIAPRWHLSCHGHDDPLTPPEGVASIDAITRRVYESLGVTARWRSVGFPGGHQESPTMRATVLAFLETVHRCESGKLANER